MKDAIDLRASKAYLASAMRELPAMQAGFKFKTFALGVLLLGAATGSAALGLGRAQGTVFIGRSLDMRFQLLLDANEDLQTACMGAEVFYGDTPLDAGRISVTVEPSTSGSSIAMVRVVSSATIDEPIVTINLRAGCQQKSTKRYTLFPEVSSNQVDPAIGSIQGQRAPSAAAPVLPSVGREAVGGAPRQSVSANGESVASKAPKRRAAPRTDADAPAAQQTRLSRAATSAGPVQVKPSKSAGKARLKLDPLDLLLEVNPVLRGSDELLTQPQENPEKRAEAAAYWRALNASPEDILREAAQAQRMEKDLKSLYAITAENQKGLTELVAKIQRAEAERYSNWLVYTLLFIACVSLAGLVWVWRRSGATPARSWQHGWDAGDSIQSEPMLSTQAVGARKSEPGRRAVEEPTGLTEVDFDLGLLEAAPSAPAPATPGLAQTLPPTGQSNATSDAPPAPAQVPTQRAQSVDFAPSTFGGLRTTDSEDLLDVRQQAEFFVSLGEHQKAIDVLTTRIAQCGESSPLVCLDLLKIYHALGREADFEFMRTEFNTWFTGVVPVLAHFGDEGRSLDHYPQVLDEIAALWPEPSVLDYIESCLYHHAAASDDPRFDLLAYRELLLLHAVAKRIIRLSEGGGDFQASELIRLPARAPTLVLHEGEKPASISDVIHRAGAEHRGGWKRKAAPQGESSGPELGLVSRSAPLGAMKVPPVVAPPPSRVESKSDRDDGPETDFNFLTLD